MLTDSVNLLIFSNNFITNFPQNVMVKNFENRSTFGEDVHKSLQLFFSSSCMIFAPSPVCLSVRLSHGWISQKRLKLGFCNLTIQ